MSAGQYTYVEQDKLESPSGNELPTYDDLAAQNGPNSRFGRWREWIEKRAAERYAEITPEIRARRRERGWDLDSGTSSGARPQSNVVDHNLYIQTSNLTLQDPPEPTPKPVELNAPLPFVSQVIEPTHLKINHFGSRFLPHTTSQIRCVLPLLGDRILLIGHDEGLSVMDMFPQEWSENGDLITKGPDEAQSRLIWRGESVHQMSILETENHGDGILQGVVLIVVGPMHEFPTMSKDHELAKTARMYNLASLISLARYTIAQKGTIKPLELHKLNGWHAPTTPSKRHRAHGSIARGIKSLIDNGSSSSSSEQNNTPQPFLSPTPTAGQSHSKVPTPSERGSPTSSIADSTWDIIDDLPLRWATDFVPLAAAGSRLAGQSVLSFATWNDESRQGKNMGGQLLAIAVKGAVLLYETPKGERAYRFVKEFYTPMQPRSVSFVQQSVTDIRNPMEGSPGRFHSHKRSDSGGTLKGVINTVSSSVPLNYGTHLSLFVIFDKKAGWIRLADSAVGEVELGEDGGPQAPGFLHSRDTYPSTVSSSSLRQRARLSFDIRESAAKWISPVRIDLPTFGAPNAMQPVHILTRGKRSHVVPCPLPIRSSATPPLHCFFWRSHPKNVWARLIPAGRDQINDPPLLQVIAFGENGIEIQETGVSFMNTKGKGRAFPEEIIRAEEDLGGEAGFLASGGNWDKLASMYNDSGSMTAASSVPSFAESMDSVDLLALMKQQEGIYGWCRKGITDWRIFWIGGGRDETSNHGGADLEYRDSMSSMYV